MNTFELWLIVCAILGAAYLIARWFDRRATKTINSHLDAALLHGPDWTDDAAADCLDCAAAARDGHHDSLELTVGEEVAWQRIERYEREAR